MTRPRSLAPLSPLACAALFLSSCLASWLAAPALAQRTLIHAGSLIDGVGDRPASEKTVVVERGRIVAIEDGYTAAAAGDEVLNLRRRTVLPGLFDLHVHLVSEQSPRSFIEGVTFNPPDHAVRATVYARRTLEAGFTSVRDLGGDTDVITALRDAIDQGIVPGPKIYAATGSLASTGGHGDPSNGLPRRWALDPTAADGVVNSVDDARKAVRQRYKEGADTIKITATGGVLSYAKSGDNPQFTVAEIEEIVRTANDYGFIVAAHAHGSEGMRRAVLGGVTTIEHGTYMTDEIMQLMIERGTWFVPTISAGRFVAEKAKIDGYFPEIIRPKAAAIGPVIAETFAKAYEAGVPIAFGTDCGVCPHGSNAKEFGYMVEGGMPAMEAIQAATGVAARVLRVDELYGTLEVGKMADVIAVDGDPLRDIGAMERVVFVMKGGAVHRHDAAMP
ncbi:MAG: amidohydrolase family protein [Acidobacteria bacterium]|nr:MAG: amidohydrolase family protein [Acidobacteriota bacterium]REK04235.1 MAG: amidohydrolase family protein [Acidobacteriota bacterium]